MPVALLDTIEGWLAASGAEELADSSHSYLTPDRRAQIAAALVTVDKSPTRLKCSRASPRRFREHPVCGNSLMPTAQFDVLENLDNPIIQTNRKNDGHALWARLGAERTGILTPWTLT